jgi:hypothetical protein
VTELAGNAFSNRMRFMEFEDFLSGTDRMYHSKDGSAANESKLKTVLDVVR